MHNATTKSKSAAHPNVSVVSQVLEAVQQKQPVVAVKGLVTTGQMTNLVSLSMQLGQLGKRFLIVSPLPTEVASVQKRTKATVMSVQDFLVQQGMKTLEQQEVVVALHAEMLPDVPRPRGLPITDIQLALRAGAVTVVLAEL